MRGARGSLSRAKDSPMSSNIVIEARGLSKAFPVYAKPHHRLMQMLMPGDKKRWYREFHALKNIGFSIRRGETVGIVGQNGSGKSTLLQIVCGIITPSTGEVMVRGRIAALLELGAGFNPEFTGRENVFLNATVLGLARDEIERRFDDIAAFAGIGEFIDQPVKTYSSGMYVRLAFSVAINVDPDILIVDEALSVGDEAFQRKCFARIEAIKEKGATILFVSHSATAVVDLCDRAMLVDQGELLATGEPKTIVSQYQRMLHAPQESVRAIRDEIKASREAPAVAGRSQQPSSETLQTYSDQQAYWDEGLVVASSIAYESRGACISDVRIETLDGRRVNVLVSGESYVCRYSIKFEKNFNGLRCGMMIKTVTGAELGGTVTAQSHDAIAAVEAGDILDARFVFRCMLARGVYFMNAGVLARMAEGEEFIDRRIDIGIFRVGQSKRPMTGFVDFEFVPQIEIAR